MTAPQPNAELAYRVLDHIDAHPKQWHQGWWLTELDCGTAACFAGWACLLSGDKPDLSDPDEDEGQEEKQFSFVELPDGSKRYVEARAADLLGIGRDRSVYLFDADNGREDLGRMVAEYFGPRPAAEHVVIDHVFRLPKPGTGHLCAYMGCGLPREAHTRAAGDQRRAKASPS